MVGKEASEKGPWPIVEDSQDASARRKTREHIDITLVNMSSIWRILK